MTNTTFQNGRKARNTWLAGKIKCGKCGYALKTTHNPSSYEYLRCSNVPSGPTTRAVRGDTLTGAYATLLAYANKKIEDLDNRRKTLSKAIADLSVETLSSQQIKLLSGYLDDWENISFEDKRKAADGLISSISATSDYVKIEWKI